MSIIEGERLKTEGMAKAEAAYPYMDFARRTAIALCECNGTVTADDVARYLSVNGFPPLGNACGALFRNGEFEPTGERRKSTRASRHCNEIRVWRRKGSK